MTDHFDRPWVISLGLCTPIGLDAATSLVEVAAGTARFGELSVVDRRNEPVSGSFLPVVSATDRSGRICAIGRRAAWEALGQARRMGLEVSDLPVFIGLPEDDGVSVDLDRLRADLVQVAGGVRLHFPPATHATLGWACQQGRAGFFFALTQALAALDSHAANAVLVGGVDSLCDERSRS